MSDKLLEETRFNLRQKKALGTKRCYDTLVAWAKVGRKSKMTGEIVKLEVIQEGGNLTTSKEAVERFLLRLSGAKV